MRWVVVAASVAVFAVVPAGIRVAHAQVFDSSSAENYPAPPTERRGGFHIGLSGNYGYGGTVGYPNKLGQIGNPEFRAVSTGFASSTALWMGGMLRDWLGFSAGVRLHSTLEEDEIGATFGLVLHLEVYPAYSLGGMWRNVGVLAEFGAGGGAIVDSDEEVLAQGGALGVLGVGVFWEPWRFWHFSSGPVLQYGYAYSESLHAQSVTLGLRLAFYGVQP